MSVASERLAGREVMGGNKPFRRVQGGFEMIADESSCA